MTPTISKLWNGELRPIENFGKYNREINHLENLIESNYESLKKQIDDRGGKLLEKYKNCIDEYTFLSCEQSFCDGFCLAVKIMTESLLGAEQVI